MKKSIKLALFSLTALLIMLSCKEKKHKHKDKDKEKEEQVSDVPAAQQVNNSSANNKSAVAGCDTSLWKYVYNPSRLEVILACKTVTGVIEESNADEDGDQHMLLKLDAGQEDLLTKKNKKKKDGNLVIEAVCMNNTTLKKVGNTCNGYVNHIQLPKIGDHVTVTGSYVIDSHNGWSEIHPITGIIINK